MDWREKSKYYITWEKYIAMHPEIDEKNQVWMKARFEAYQEKMFKMVIAFLL